MKVICMLRSFQSQCLYYLDSGSKFSVINHVSSSLKKLQKIYAWHAGLQGKILSSPHLHFFCVL